MHRTVDRGTADVQPGTRLVLDSALEKRHVIAKRPQLLVAAALLALVFVPMGLGAPDGPLLAITRPMEGTLFPRDLAPPMFRWRGDSRGGRWRVAVEAPVGHPLLDHECTTTSWRPTAEEWMRIVNGAVGRIGRFRVRLVGTHGQGGGETEAAVSFSVSSDPVGAPIFYREVPLPVGYAMDHKPLIRWKVADLSSGDQPRVVLSGMTTCANCHSFSADGRTLGMDLDFASDKGAYAIAPVSEVTRITSAEMMSWNDYRREDGESTFGLLTTISPDGRYAVSTTKETIFLKFLPDPDCSQLFFPIRGILVAYDRLSRAFRPVKGADRRELIQTNPAFSPDGRWLVFARAPVLDLPRSAGVVTPDTVENVTPSLVEGTRRVCFDLFRLPFSEGSGGDPLPILGASSNGRSNFFPRFSPDGRWIVYCQASSMMLNRLDSALYIIPAAGGAARRLRSNFDDRMNSWHSFSPNGKWLVFASKATGPLTQFWLTHIDPDGSDSVPFMLEGLVDEDRAGNLPEFADPSVGRLKEISVSSVIKFSGPPLPRPAK